MWDVLDSLADSFDLEGNRISSRRLFELEEEARLRGGSYRQVGLDRVGAVTVSTVLLPGPHPSGRPGRLLFESMVSSPAAEEFFRYATLQEALEGHARILAGLAALPPA